jgi:hypothetical protein
MSLERYFEVHLVAGKAVYVVDDHHKALAAWALLRRGLDAPPYLLTIDHHTDTDDAFAGHARLTAFDNPSIDEQALAAELLAAVDWRSDTSVVRVKS